MNGGPKFTNFTSEFPVWGILLSVTWDIVKICMCTKFDSYTRSNFIKGCPNLQIWPWTPPHPTWGNFVIYEMGHVRVPNFEVSSFTNLWKGVQNLQFLPLNSQHTPFGGILLSVTWNMSRSICAQNLMFLATPVQNLWKGSKIYKFGPWTPTTPPLG